MGSCEGNEYRYEQLTTCTRIMWLSVLPHTSQELRKCYEYSGRGLMNRGYDKAISYYH